MKTSSDVLELRSEFDKLKAAWAETAKSNKGVDGEGRTVFGPVTTSIVKLLNLIGDNSNLVLDPDIDSFYLINSLVLAVPQLAEDMGNCGAGAPTPLPKAVCLRQSRNAIRYGMLAWRMACARHAGFSTDPLQPIRA